MIKFFKDNPALRVALIAGFFLVGLLLIYVGYIKMPGELKGILVMLGGVACLLAAMWTYNVVFTDPKDKKKKKA